MKIYSVGLGLAALAAATSAQELSNEYLPPTEDFSVASAGIEQIQEAEPAAVLADDGYRYKTVRRLRHRRRRDVNELPSNEYLPPVAGDLSVAAPGAEYLAPEQESAVLADDGYRYKTVRRLRHRRRRDVNELPSNEYLPPTAAEEATPVEAPVEAAVEQDSAVLADDGYRYKTVRRIRYRRRRDVNELPSNEYLPPVEEAAPVEAPVEQDSAVLADDGYRYKTVRRLRYRHRRDVNELPSNEYLPPVEEAAPVEAAVEQDSAVLADDGYRYKTVRRLRYRHRRDVNELPSNEYLPPVEEAAPVEAPVEQDSAVLADDGYRYKTVRRLRYRRRRDVNELPSNEYLPPTAAEEAAPVEAPVEAAVEQDSAVLADDGYRYKTVRRIRYRRRRDVNELPSNEYLPPVDAEEAAPVEAPVEQDSAVLADDGYRYKTVRRIRYRHRRDVNELPSNEYLPPTAAEEAAPVEAPVEAAVEQDSAVLADDGYRYKTVRRIRYRRRRDVNELPSNEYLPPVAEAELEAPVESAVLADDGYRYKTVRKYKVRRH